MGKTVLIAGPCVIEDAGLVLEIAEELKRQLADLPVEFFFKASFDKANRTSVESFRGPGLDQGLEVLGTVKSKTGLNILTDVHLPEHVAPVSEVVDFLQIPAFLCRQTDLVVAAAEAAKRKGLKLNIKKGQFLAPWDTSNIIQKVRSSGWNSDGDFFITERGVSFGYNRLVVDMTSFQTIQSFGVPVIYDATHSVQLPGGDGKSTGGQREYLEVLARGAVAAGADGVFLECHPDPKKAKSDSSNAFYLDCVGPFVKQLLEIQAVVKNQPKLLPEAQVHGETSR